ncbi:hypothetical protein J8TS2_35750 [Lederbergia ruris]|uniref:MurNAc-LAA domain-containing protein n=1 Tax=Lederbergia ruris TaxID=217495 RepID=A0ABQ4KMU5_9BACI|nr:N-acetylmuramoyl-L-alanine amidase [Lederbergia ruris]GIN59256.1 hypothetical protein J8TS2_35750 [Lederbergia ruris]
MAKTIALDIGHGKNTFPPSKGVYKNGKGYAEHDFNSKLAIEVEKLLKTCGFNVIVYQKPYANDVPLIQRTNYYNSKKVDLVYSLHANANGSSDVNGRCVFYWHTAKDSKKLAEIVVDEIKKAGYSTHGNGLHASMVGSWTDLHICRETDMTAVLVENGFMSGNKDFDLVFGSKQGQYIKDMAEVHAKAICRYYGVKYKATEDVKAKPKPSTPKQPNKPVSKPKASTKTNSIVDYLKAKKMDSSFANRAKLAAEYGIKGYSGTAKQNLDLLFKLKAGKPVSKPSKPTSKPKTYKVGQKVKIKSGAKKYSRSAVNIPTQYKNKSYTIQQVGKDDVLIKELYSWVRKSDLQ